MSQEVLEELMVKLALDLKDFSLNMDKATGRMSQFEKESSAISSKMGDQWKTFGNIIKTAIATYAVKAFGDFEDAVISTAGNLADSQSDFEGLKRVVGDLSKELSQNTIYSVNDTAKALHSLAIEGFDATKRSAKELNPILDFATATNMSLAEATDVTINTLKLFGYGLDDVGRIGASVVGAIGASKEQVQNFSNALRMAGGDIKASGASIEDLATIVGHFDSAGIQAKQATAGLKEVLQSLQNPSDALSASLKTVGLSTSDLSIKQDGLVGTLKKMSDAGFTSQMAMRSFSEETAGAISSLFAIGAGGESAVSGLSDLSKSLVNGTSAIDMAKLKTEGFNNQVKIIVENLKQVGYAIGEQLLPYLKDLTSSLISVQKYTQEWAKENPRLAESMTVAVTAIGGVTGAILLASKAFDAYKKASLALAVSNPVLGVITATTIALTSLAWAWNEAERAEADYHDAQMTSLQGSVNQYKRVTEAIEIYKNNVALLSEEEKREMTLLEQRSGIIYRAINAELKKDEVDQISVDRMQSAMLKMEAQAVAMRRSIETRQSMNQVVEQSVISNTKEVESLDTLNIKYRDISSGIENIETKAGDLYTAFSFGAIDTEGFTKGVDELVVGLGGLGLTAEDIGPKLTGIFNLSAQKEFGAEIRNQTDAIKALNDELISISLEGEAKLMAQQKIKYQDEINKITEKKIANNQMYSESLLSAKKANDEEIALIKARTQTNIGEQLNQLEAQESLYTARKNEIAKFYESVDKKIEEEAKVREILTKKQLEDMGLTKEKIDSIISLREDLIAQYTKETDLQGPLKDAIIDAEKSANQFAEETLDNLRATELAIQSIISAASSSSGGTTSVSTVSSGDGAVSAAEGEWNVPKDQLYFLHAKEMVAPPAVAEAIRSKQSKTSKMSDSMGFASLGLQGASGSAGSGSAGSSQAVMNITIVNKIDSGFVAEAMGTEEGSDTIVNVIGKDAIKKGVTSRLLKTSSGGLR